MEAYIARLREIDRVLNEVLFKAQQNANEGKRPPGFAYDFAIAEIDRIIEGAPFNATDTSPNSPLWIDTREKIDSLETMIFNQICEEITIYKDEILNMSKDISNIDTIYSIFKIANNNKCIKPVLSEDNKFDIRDALHPVIDKTLGFGKFVPNDLNFSNKTNTAIITGPNMSGKSTYLRTMAIIVILSQVGSFVPASKCEIGIVDRIFTRTGLTDDIHTGKSTFLIEMEETSRILAQSTNKSFAVLDEIGRGTSTYDGLSIAWSILEYINTKEEKKFRTLFATHFHELTKLPETYPNIINLQVAVHEENNSINFLIVKKNFLTNYKSFLKK